MKKEFLSGSKSKKIHPAAPDAAISVRRQNKEKIGREIAGELRGLRSLTQEVFAQIEIRIRAEIAGLIRIFEGETTAGEKHPLPPAQAEKQLLVRVRALKVKPKKGRIKDMARIHGLLAEIRSAIEGTTAKSSRKK